MKTNSLILFMLSILISNMTIEANTNEKENGKNDPTKTDWEEISKSAVLLSFLVKPAFDSPYGFCMIEKKGEYFLITKIIDNWEEVNKQMQDEFPTSSIKLFEMDTISQAEKDRRGALNKIQRQKRAEKALTLYSEAIKEYPIDKKEAKELYLHFVSFIDQYKKTDLPKKDVVSEEDTIEIELISDDGFGITISYTKDNTTKSVSEREIYLSEGFREIYEECRNIMENL
ncbi:MAG: hypothetical protein GX102_02940 [Porphyromonadaceae bacterium]|nr:hypothetical protein [Porphyromonadaceae bacterium]